MNILKLITGNYVMVIGYLIWASLCVSIIIGARNNKKDFGVSLALLDLIVLFAIILAYAIVPSMYVLYMLGFISLLIIALTFVIFRGNE